MPRRRSVLDALRPYIQGLGSLPGQNNFIKLSSNESPYGPAPEALQAYHSAADEMSRYGDGQQTLLRAAIAKTHDLPMDNVLCGNGSDELISMLIRAFMESGDEIVVSENGFVMTSTHAIVAGGRVVAAPESDWIVDVDQILSAISPKTRIVSICNPNNPTGTFVSISQMRRLIESVPPQVILHMDEAYAEYAMHEDQFSSALEFLAERNNLVVTRTFSKAYGLAGLRIGWLAADPLVIDAIDRLRTPFNANTAAQVAATASLACQEWLRDVIERNRDVRERFARQMRGLGLEVISSVTNFVLIRFPIETDASGSGAYQALQDSGFLVRPTSAGDAYLRISMGTSRHMQDVAKVIEAYLANYSLESDPSNRIE